MSKKKIYIFIGIAVVVLIIIAIAKGRVEGSAFSVTVENAQRRTIVETVTASGTIQPETEVKITSDVSGEIIGLNVVEGQKVKKGDLLVKINPNVYESAKERAAAAVNSAKANLANAKARLSQSNAQFINAELTYKRNKSLYEKKAISQADYENSEANYKVAKAEVDAADQSVVAAQFNVESATASLNEAIDNLNKTTIYSPMNGTISSLSKEKGERVVGTNMMDGTEIMRVADLSNMIVNVDVNENDIVRVHKNDTAEIVVDAFLDKKFKGIVTQIANSAKSLLSGAASSTDQVKNFEVEIKILRSSYADMVKDTSSAMSPFRPGMSASVDIITSKKFDVLSVPIQAVTTREDTTKSSGEDAQVECIFVNNNGKASQKNITTGIQDTRYIEITKGISDSTKVISGPYTIVSKQLEDGSPIEIVEKHQLFETNKKP